MGKHKISLTCFIQTESVFLTLKKKKEVEKALIESEEMKYRNGNIDILLDTILVEIFLFMKEPINIAHIALTCKRFRNIIQHNPKIWASTRTAGWKLLSHYLHTHPNLEHPPLNVLSFLHSSDFLIVSKVVHFIIYMKQQNVSLKKKTSWCFQISRIEWQILFEYYKSVHKNNSTALGCLQAIFYLISISDQNAQLFLDSKGFDFIVSIDNKNIKKFQYYILRKVKENLSKFNGS